MNLGIDLSRDDEFYFWLPFQIDKAATKDKEKGTRRWIQGIASTPDVDLQSEVVEQRGIDFSYFLEHGYFNNDHKPGFENKVGEPTECKITSKGLWVKGFLYKNKKISDSIWEMALSLEASQSSRKLGFSIQGKVQRRAGRRILKCWIQDIAITAAPINTNTWLDVVKSLNSVPADYWCDDTGCFYVSPRTISPVHKSNCGTCQKNLNTAIDPSKLDLFKESSCGCHKKDKDDEQEKALSVGHQAPPQTGGNVLRVQSLEGEDKDQNWGRTSKSLQFEECIDIVMKSHKLDRLQAQIVAEAVFEMNGQTIN